MNVRIPLNEGINGTCLHTGDQSIVTIFTMISIYIQYMPDSRRLTMTLYRHKSHFPLENQCSQESLSESFVLRHITESCKFKLKRRFFLALTYSYFILGPLT